MHVIIGYVCLWWLIFITLRVIFNIREWDNCVWFNITPHMKYLEYQWNIITGNWVHYYYIENKALAGAKYNTDKETTEAKT
jgi:hypothetical protein